MLLDLMMPGLAGEEVLKRIEGIPVIVVSARADVEDKVELLLGGAVDYVTKPFDRRELLARIAVHLRRAEKQDGAEGGQVLVFRDLKMDTAAYRVWAGEEELHITHTAISMLKKSLVDQCEEIADAGRVVAR